MTIIHGDCLDVLKTLPDCSVDAVVTDPPYGLSFMGKAWDYDVPTVEVWRECLRVLKPGGHLLAFAGTRTQHRMAVAIEDAGFEIRDMIAWVYGSGFPKSHDVIKAIDKAAGAEREVVGRGTKGMRVESTWGGQNASGVFRPNADGCDLTAPATDAAKQWQGWGTALKPALETVTFASKPYTEQQERDIILSKLIRLEARLWLLLFVSAAEKNSTSNQSEYVAACATAQWSAEEVASTRGDLYAQMDTSLFESAAITSLNIVSSWRRTLEESWSNGNTCIIETLSSTTIDLRTLKFSLSLITPEGIIKACSLPGGFSANASTAENHFNASLLLLQSIHTLSATENVMLRAQHDFPDEVVKPNLDPVVMARKPFPGTVAENVLAWGTGAINVDGCRVEGGSCPRSALETPCHEGYGNGMFRNKSAAESHPSGRWPANLIHDGSAEVVGLFPAEAKGMQRTTLRRGATTGTSIGGNGRYGTAEPQEVEAGYGDSGSAARFFYCAKASKRDRDEGLQNPPQLFVQFQTGNGASGKPSSLSEGRNTQYRNHHPTVKPTELMRYLVRLVTPPGGVVLDPFMGSGSTGKACALEGFAFIGIEREAEYVEIARARIAAVSPEPLTSVASVAPARHAPAPKPAPAGQLSLFDEI